MAEDQVNTLTPSSASLNPSIQISNSAIPASTSYVLVGVGSTHQASTLSPRYTNSVPSSSNHAPTVSANTHFVTTSTPSDHPPPFSLPATNPLAHSVITTNTVAQRQADGRTPGNVRPSHSANSNDAPLTPTAPPPDSFFATLHAFLMSKTHAMGSPPPYSPPRSAEALAMQGDGDDKINNQPHQTLRPSTQRRPHGDQPARPSRSNRTRPTSTNCESDAITTSVLTPADIAQGDCVPAASPKPSKPRSLKAAIQRKKFCPPYTLGANFVFFYCISFLVLVTGCATLVLGAVAYFDEEKLSALVGQDSSGRLQTFDMTKLLKSSSVFLIVAGAAIVFLGFLGCCGVLVKSKTMVATFGLLVLLLLLTQLTVGILAWIYNGTARQNLQQVLVKRMKLEYDGRPNSTHPLSQGLDFLQASLGCCGVTGVSDFEDTPWFQQRALPNMTVPPTCCKLDKPTQSRFQLADINCPFKQPGPHNPYTARSCLNVMQSLTKKHIGIVLCLTLVMVVAQAASMCSAFKLVAKMMISERPRWFLVQAAGTRP